MLKKLGPTEEANSVIESEDRKLLKYWKRLSSIMEELSSPMEEFSSPMEDSMDLE